MKSYSTNAGDKIPAAKITLIFHYFLNYVPVISHPLVEPGREELGLLENVSGIHDPVVLICPVQNKLKRDTFGKLYELFIFIVLEDNCV